MKILPVVMAAVIAIGCIGNASAEIATHVKKAASGVRSFKDFSLKETPCFIRAPGLGSPDSPELRRLFSEAGINVTTDKDAKCNIVVSGFVTMQNGDSKPVTPANAELLLNNRNSVIEVGPALAATDVSLNKAPGNVNLMDGALSAGAVSNLERAGNAFGGASGSTTAIVAALLIDVTAGITARNSTPPGVANISVNAMVGHFLPASLGLNVYAAATTKESPAVLLNAAVERFVEELRKEVDKDVSKDLEEKTKASMTTDESPW